MKYSLVNGSRKEAHPDSRRGICPHCQAESHAKCGKSVVWHWAHKAKASCDPWWENETKWHRDWKNQFPVEWQEVTHAAPNGEKHIADVKTPAGLCIEFQHSNIPYTEQSSRDVFYSSLVWVVDGRAKLENARTFQLSKSHRPHTLEPLSFALKWQSRTELLERWSFSIKPVLFDFGDRCIWHLKGFNRHSKSGVVTPYCKSRFVADCETAESFDKLVPMSIADVKQLALTKAKTVATIMRPPRKARF